MDFYPSITKLEKDLARVKSTMLYAAKIFNDRFPAKDRTGAVVLARCCAKSKHCPRCPHSLLWNRYIFKFVTTKDGTKKWMRFWLPKPTPTVPRGIHLPQSGRPFREFQPVMETLNTHNTSLTRQIMRLNTFAREAEKRRIKGAPLAYGRADLVVTDVLIEHMVRCKDSLALDHVDRMLRDFANQYPLHADRRVTFSK